MNGKKMFAVLSAICLTVMLVCPLSTAASAAATFTIGTVSAASGETVTVPLSITQVSDISAISAHLYYDTSVLECVSAETRGMMLDMDMADAVATPVNAPGEVWLSGVSLDGVAGGGEIMVVTFKVKENAKSGLSVIGFSGDWAPELITSGTDLVSLEYALKDGGVNVKSGAQATAAKTTIPTADAQTDPQHTTAPVANATTAADNTPVGTTASSFVPTLADGKTVPVTEETVVDVQGNVVTNPNGEAVKYPTVAIVLDEVTADAEGVATVTMSMSAVEGLTAVIVDVSYDAQALDYVGYTIEGFAKDMNMIDAAQQKDGVVTLSGTDPVGVSGSGVVATLTFKVKSGAKGGEYRLAMTDEILLIADQVELPFKTYTGIITVGGEAAAFDATYVVVGIVVVAAAAVVVLLVLVSRRKKKATPLVASTSTDTPASSLNTDVSGEE